MFNLLLYSIPIIGAFVYFDGMGYVNKFASFCERIIKTHGESTVNTIKSHHTRVINKLHNKYQKFKRIKKIVSGKQKNIIYATLSTIYFILKMYLDKTLNKYYPNTQYTIQKGDDYVITYFIKSNKYKFTVNKNNIKQTSNVLFAFGEQNESIIDLTNDLECYLGPTKDFHGCVYTPKYFGVDKITIETVDGEEKIYERDEEIKI